jgi:hypothetical protein
MASQQPGGDYRSDAVELDEAGAVLGEDPRHLGGDLLEAGVKLSDLGIGLASAVVSDPGLARQRRSW